jgi:hypothetical protein
MWNTTIILLYIDSFEKKKGLSPSVNVLKNVLVKYTQSRWNILKLDSS